MKKSTLFILFLSIGIFCACHQEKTCQLKVMSYNIRHGEGMDSVLDLSRASEVIMSQAPDLCALQEIDNFCLRSDSVGQTDYLAQRTGMLGSFGKFMNYQGGQYGMATLSEKPLLSTKVLQLPDGIHEPRSAIIHEVQIDEDLVIVFVNVHFDWVEGDQGEKSRLNQAQTLIRYLDALDLAVIIAGDFNCTPNSPAMRYFAAQGFEFIHKGVDNLSFQGDQKAEIDHIIFRNTTAVRFKAQSINLLNEPVVSDHRPLIANLEIVH